MNPQAQGQVSWSQQQHHQQEQQAGHRLRHHRPAYPPCCWPGRPRSSCPWRALSSMISTVPPTLPRWWHAHRSSRRPLSRRPKAGQVSDRSSASSTIEMLSTTGHPKPDRVIHTPTSRLSTPTPTAPAAFQPPCNFTIGHLDPACPRFVTIAPLTIRGIGDRFLQYLLPYLFALDANGGCQVEERGPCVMHPRVRRSPSLMS